MTHPSSCRAVSADVTESFLVISVGRAERNFLDRLIDDQSLRLILYDSQTVARYVKHRAHGPSSRVLEIQYKIPHSKMLESPSDLRNGSGADLFSATWCQCRLFISANRAKNNRGERLGENTTWQTFAKLTKLSSIFLTWRKRRKPIKKLFLSKSCAGLQLIYRCINFSRNIFVWSILTRRTFRASSQTCIPLDSNTSTHPRYCTQKY